MPPLPPVRKRTSYDDIDSDDLTFALFHDRIVDAQPPIHQGDTPSSFLVLKDASGAYRWVSFSSNAARTGRATAEQAEQLVRAGLAVRTRDGKLRLLKQARNAMREKDITEKAQTASERAMFARMGSGGGGGGKGSGGGASQLWSKGPDGKRQPSKGQLETMREREGALYRQASETYSQIRKLRDEQAALRSHEAWGQKLKPRYQKERDRKHDELETQIRDLRAKHEQLNRETEHATRQRRKYEDQLAKQPKADAPTELPKDLREMSRTQQREMVDYYVSNRTPAQIRDRMRSNRDQIGEAREQRKRYQPGSPDHDRLVRAEESLMVDQGLLMAAEDKLDRLSKKKPKEKSVLVLKDASGAYRWVSFSSNAYRDRDDEIVSTKALESDVARADADGQYGPLRWWHVGAPLGPGLDIGACDFNAMHGRVLIESGTFSDARIAHAVAKAADQLQVSIGFVHPASDPDEGGVFHHIRRFERSLVPAGRAANPFTKLVVKEIPDMATLKERWEALVNLLGEETAREVAAGAETTQKAADDAGVTYKADTSGGGDLAAELAALRAEVASLKAAQTAQKDDGQGDIEVIAEEAPEAEIEGDEDSGEMSAYEFLDEIDARMEAKLDAKIAQFAGLVAPLTAKKDADDAERASEIARLKERLAALEGDAPIAFNGGFRASADPSTVATKEQAAQLGAPVADPNNPFADITAALFGPAVAHPNGS
jgi:hypothetical protein